MIANSNGRRRTFVTDAGEPVSQKLERLVLRHFNANIPLVQLNRALTNALYEGQVLSGLEWAVLLAVINDRLGLGKPDTLQLIGNGLSASGIDIDRASERPQRHAGDQKR